MFTHKHCANWMLPLEIQHYWNFHEEITIEKGFFQKVQELSSPQARDKILKQLHTGYLGLWMCLHIAKKTIYWPGLHYLIHELVTNITYLNFSNNNHKQPASQQLRQEVPLVPWGMFAIDIFLFESCSYQMVVHYHQGVPVIYKLAWMIAKHVAGHMKAIFFGLWMARYLHFW